MSEIEQDFVSLIELVDKRMKRILKEIKTNIMLYMHYARAQALEDVRNNWKCLNCKHFGKKLNSCVNFGIVTPENWGCINFEKGEE